MGLGDVLFGRKKLKGAKLDRLFALSTARITLETELGLKPAGVAAVVFKPLSAGEFVRAESDLDELLGVAAARLRLEGQAPLGHASASSGSSSATPTSRTSSRRRTSSARSSRRAASAASSSPRSSSSRGGEHPVYLIYGYKPRRFWPFVPTGEEQERDNAEELELKAELEKELPIEPDLTRWLALFDAPLDD